MRLHPTTCSDRYNRMVASMAILGDERATWRPDRFGYSLWGCSVGFQFAAVKLLEYGGRGPLWKRIGTRLQSCWPLANPGNGRLTDALFWNVSAPSKSFPSEDSMLRKFASCVRRS